MRERVSIPIKVANKKKWGDLTVFGDSHEICGETVRETDSKYSFTGGHRVRLYKFKKNVHWKIPTGTDLDISSVPPGQNPPRRRQR